MITRIKRWWSSRHRWRYSEYKEYRTCRHCGQKERHYEWEGAYWWGILDSGDTTKPCYKKPTSHISPPY